MRRGRLPALRWGTLPDLDQLRGSKMERRIRELEVLYRRLSIDHIRKGLQHVGVRCAVIGLRICFGVPEAVGNRFQAFGRDQGGFIAETFLLTQDRENLSLADPVEFCGWIGLEL